MGATRAGWRSSREYLVAFAGYAALTTFVFFGSLIVWYAKSFPVNAYIPWPSFGLLKESVFKERSSALADVAWMHAAVIHGYERLPTDGSDPYAGQHNWAYFPLAIYLGKAVTLVTRDVWWSLQWISIASVAGLLTFARALRRRWDETTRGAQWALSHELLLLFFVLPLTWASINFVVLPMLLEYSLFFAVLSLSSKDSPSPRDIGVVCALAMLAAFARPQGLIVDAILAMAVLFHVRSSSLRARAILVLALLAPIVCLLLFYRIAIGSAFAWYHVQKTWGRSLTLPWRPLIEEVKSGFVVSGYTSCLFLGFRLLLIAGAIGWAVRSWFVDLRHDRRSPILAVEGWILGASLALAVLPFTTGTMLGSHRLLCFSMYPFFTSPLRNLGLRLPIVVLLGIVAVRLLEMTFFFHGSFFAIW